METVASYISNVFEGEHVAYIYILVTRRHGLVYVGQTNDRGGTIARLNGHCSIGGTFRTKFERTTGLSLSEANDLTLLSFCLGQERMYTSTESTYREGVEYLVQIALREVACKVKQPYRIVSTVRTNTATGVSKVRQMAGTIVEAFMMYYSRDANETGIWNTL